MTCVKRKEENEKVAEKAFFSLATAHAPRSRFRLGHTFCGSTWWYLSNSSSRESVLDFASDT